VPLLNGFLSKEMFLAETLALDVTGIARVLIPLAATIAAAFSVAYSVRFIHDVFFNGTPKDLPHAPHEPPRFMRVPVEILVVVCVLVGVFPEQTVGPLLRIAAAPALRGPLPEFSLALWHGFNLPLGMSAAALAGGALLYFGLQRLTDLHAFVAVLVSGKRVFDGLQAGLLRIASALRHGLPYLRLPGMVGWIVAVAIAAAAWPLAQDGLGFAAATPAVTLHASTPALVVALGIWTLGVIATVLAVVYYRRRLVALIAVGAVGLAVSLAFAMLSAPDLALTQLLVEVVTVILMMVVLYYLPPASPPEPSRLRPWLDGVVAVAVGAGVTAIAYAVLTRPLAPIAPYFLERALTEGGGTNVVNVIIVDFRGFDTLGEMTVLGVAGLLVHALLASFRVPASFVPPRGDGAFNPLLLQAVTRLLLPFAVLVSVYLLLRGHNLPGGGFIAGLVLAAALVLTRVAGVGPRPDPAKIPWQPWIAWGLVLALGTGAAAMALGFPFLTSTFGHPVLPLVGEVPLASAALFDLGVFLAVVGATLLAVMAPGLLRARRTP
ncbi:MAG TPA: hydrogen gas-evolving membrane-bound hydrogenase subunit E, partial [Casimicrobiaceae bacterium]|nr:hydrogen gas-evolving membrane-bound hydrogenase subunit E [Casimicrobiaceae bacterium]